MKFVALISGGKDSTYNILHCQKNGHELVAFANLHPENEEEQELDSFMFQTVGHDLVNWYPKCSSIPLYKQAIQRNSSKNVALNYSKTKEDEIEDLYVLLDRVKKDIPDLEAVSVGAILSSYQRTRVENVCSRLGLTALSYLWQRDQRELMEEICSMSKDISKQGSEAAQEFGKLDARIIKVAAVGLNQSHLGKSLPELLPTMIKLNSMYEVHICGEGGEFETMVLDAPFFKNGHLELKSIEDVTDDKNDGVFNASFNVEFVPHELPAWHLQKQLDKLLTPEVLSEKWQEVYSRMKSENLEDLNTSELDPSWSNPNSFPISINEVGKLLYISNIASSNTDSLKANCLEVFSQLDSILKSRSIFPSQILSSSLLLSDMSNFQEVNSYYNDFFDVEKNGPLPPARACVETSLLNHPLQLSVIVDLSSRCLPVDGGIILNTSKDGLHVQGRSYWCPNNIGPYSQATWNNSDRNQVTYISGQIGLEPASMELWKGNDGGSKVPEIVLSLRNYFTLSETINSNTPVSMVCYISDSTSLQIVTKAWSLLTETLPNESEHWFDQDPIEQNILIIVKVSKLPKGAICEWGGINCQQLVIEDDYDEDDLAAQIHKNLTLKSQTELQLPLDATDITISENGVNRHFITTFLDTDDELVKTLSECKDAQITLYYTPNRTVPEYTHVEYIPVSQVYDHTSAVRTYGLIIKY